MPKKQYYVTLTSAQKEELEKYIRSGKHTARNITRARILLLSSDNKIDKEISKALQVCMATVYNTRKRFYEEGMTSTLNGYSSSGKPPKLDAKGEATLIAIACSEAPIGKTRWTMQMIADKLVELKVVDSISDETVRKHLKKANLNLG